NSSTTATGVSDGLSNTICIVECAARPLTFRNRTADPTLMNDQGLGWIDSEGPFSVDGASNDGSLEGCGTNCQNAMNKRNDNEAYSFHPGGGNFLFGDGHVQFIRETIPIKTFAALVTRNGGEVINSNDF
ncbi:MAG: DUF1559 domain-containing protein, partial [Gemmataceae bacterium]